MLKCMVALRIFPFLVHCLGFRCNHVFFQDDIFSVGL